MMEKFMTFSCEFDVFCYNDIDGNLSVENESTVSTF